MKKDLDLYLLQLQKQEDDMMKAVNEANELLTEGKMPKEQVEMIQKSMDIIHNNYQRVLYCKYLYSLPPKFIQKIRQKKLNRQLKKFMDEQADKESVVSENKDNLDIIEEAVYSVKEEIDGN